jgi:ATP-binding protein involved in chromosome partitioning
MERKNMTEKITNLSVLSAINKIKDPAINKSLVGEKLIDNIKIDGDKVLLELKVISPNHPNQDSMISEIEEAILNIDGVNSVEVIPILSVPQDDKVLSSGLNGVKNIIAVASGKGGVGKSTVAANIASALARGGAKVGLMDADVYGPNIPLMMGVEKLPPQTDAKNIEPAFAHGVKIMSIGFMVSGEQAIVWRGPMLHSAIRQFLLDVIWGELDYLVIDLPPGTGDAQLSLSQIVSVTGAVIVTLPQEVSLQDARRGIEMFHQLKIPIFGVVENMSFLTLPDGTQMDVFGGGGGEKLADTIGVKFIGAIPMDGEVRKSGDNGAPIVISQPESEAALALSKVAHHAALYASVQAIRNKSQGISINIIN